MNASQATFEKLQRYLKECIIEMKSVVWPSRKQTISHTILVVVFSIAIALFLGSLDILFSYLLQKLIIK